MREKLKGTSKRIIKLKQSSPDRKEKTDYPHKGFSRNNKENVQHTSISSESIEYKYQIEKEKTNVLVGIVLDVVCAKKSKATSKKGKSVSEHRALPDHKIKKGSMEFPLLNRAFVTFTLTKGLIEYGLVTTPKKSTERRN